MGLHRIQMGSQWGSPNLQKAAQNRKSPHRDALGGDDWCSLRKSTKNCDLGSTPKPGKREYRYRGASNHTFLTGSRKGHPKHHQSNQFGYLLAPMGHQIRVLGLLREYPEIHRFLGAHLGSLGEPGSTMGEAWLAKCAPEPNPSYIDI